MSLSEKCLVRGRVQGVFFRAATRQQAEKLDVTGYAKNMPDGSVEVLMRGTPEALGHLKAWLWQGPPAAQVSEVNCHLVEDIPPHEFRTL